MKRTGKRYSEMTTAELREATRQFDEEIQIFPPGRALSPAQKRMIAKASRRGRPRTGEGAAHVQITMERGLLRIVDQLAKNNGLTRSQLIAQSLRNQVKKAG